MNELDSDIYCVRCRKNLTYKDFRDKNEIDDFRVYQLCPSCVSDIQPEKD